MSPPAEALWAEEDAGIWSAWHGRYPEIVAHHGGERLSGLDTWYGQTLPELLRNRQPPYLLRDELVRVTEWKMRRGVWRGRNLALVRQNDAATVERTSRAAFALIPDVRKPVAALAELGGVGVATASAVLASLRPDVYPFFDELIAKAMPGLGAVAFTMPYYLRYAERLRERAVRLGPPWTPHAVGQALWAAAGGK
ncbi:MAG TPA: hypothetical protein VH877_10020 [Polyangia bacterium]|jgi:hypothetical protein|nr:hypothetical protein [Polyangia bacterium]